MTQSNVADASKQFPKKGAIMQKEIGEQRNPFLPYCHMQFGVRETVKCIDNTLNDCWLNATLQITRGTSMYTLLPQSIDQDVCPLTSHVTMVAASLQDNVSFNSYPDHPPPPGIPGVNKIFVHKCPGAGKKLTVKCPGAGEKLTVKCPGADNLAFNLAIEI